MKREKKTVTRFDQIDVFGLIGSLTLNPLFLQKNTRDFYEYVKTTENFAIGKLVCASFQDGSVNPSVKFIQRHSTYSLDTSSATHSLTLTCLPAYSAYTLFKLSLSLAHVRSFVLCVFFGCLFFNSSVEHSVLTPQHKNFFCLRFFLSVYIIIYIWMCVCVYESRSWKKKSLILSWGKNVVFA